MDEAILKSAKEKLLEKSKAWTDSVCAGHVLALPELKDICDSHGACHSWVSAAFAYQCFGGASAYGAWDKHKYTEKSKNFLTLSCHSKKRSKGICTPEACDFLVLWMAKESPFSKYILNRDDDESLTEGGVIILCGPDGASIAEAMWICKVLRFITEGSAAADTFMSLVKGGVDPMLAVLVASYVRTVKGATFGYTGLEGHSTVFYQGQDVYGLLARNVNKFAPTTSAVFTSPKDFKGPVLVGNIADKIRGFCKPIKKSDGWGGFVEGIGADADVLVQRVLEWQEELGHKPGQLFLVKEKPLPSSSTVYLELDL